MSEFIKASLSITLLSPSLSCSPVPRHVEMARPNAKISPTRGVLVTNIVNAVTPRRHSPATTDHPTTQILASCSADSHNATVTIPVALLAMDYRLANHVSQFHGCALAAPPDSSRSVNTGLAALGGIDTKQADALAVDLDRVAINDTGSANK